MSNFYSSSRTFCGILFHRTYDGQWVSEEDGIVMQENHIGTKLERWSVTESPFGIASCGTGRNIREALENSGLIESRSN